jgi:site-specific DNA recombinase
MDEGVQNLELACNAQRLFEWQEPRQKRRLLNFVLSNCFWEGGEVRATFRQPFDRVAETAPTAARQTVRNMANSAKSEIWLPFLDTYRTMCVAPKPDFLRVLEKIREIRFAS